MIAVAGAVASFVGAHRALSFAYYAYAGWPYVLAGFALGTIPFGLIVSRLVFKSDIRASGSGNIGAANAMRTYGKAAGAAVFGLDALKGALAVVLVRMFVFWPFSPPLLPHAAYGFGDTRVGFVFALAPLAALAAVLGHCYSPWLGGRGGKGVATFFGALAALDAVAAPIFAVTWIAIVWRTGFSSLASMLGTLTVAIYFIARDARVADGNCAIFFALVSLVVVVTRHRANISRLRAGTESRLRFAGG